MYRFCSCCISFLPVKNVKLANDVHISWLRICAPNAVELVNREQVRNGHSHIQKAETEKQKQTGKKARSACFAAAPSTTLLMETQKVPKNS